MHKYDNTQLIENIKSSKFFKKTDILIVVIMLIALIGVLILVFLPKGEEVVIRIDGKVAYVYKLNENRIIDITIEGEEHANVVVIEDGCVFMQSATCPNGDCVASGKISKIGQSIACLPHKLIVEIVGKENEVDTIV